MKKTNTLILLLLCFMMLFTMLTGCKEEEGPSKEDLRKELFALEKTDVAGSSADPETWVYKFTDSGITMREVTIDSGKGGDPVYISQLSDLHFNYCNDDDIVSGSEALISTYFNRKWLADGASVPIAENCLKLADAADQIMLTGDVLDYLSLGAMELMQKHIWDKYPDALACLGNHEATRVVEGTVPDETTLESRMQILQDFWPHDIYYTSKVIKDKVMVIQLENGANSTFWECQIEPFKADLQVAREKGYTVLLFYHIPLTTYNPADEAVKPITGEDVTFNFYKKHHSPFGYEHEDAASREMYDIIVNNADVIKGAFCGHAHYDMNTKIIAKNPDGSPAEIPQYVMAATGSSYKKGHILWITVK